MMGIQGLTSFIDTNSHQLLQDIELRDCPLVIDGYNFMFHLYYHFEIPHRYLGDYDYYRRCLHAVFSEFRACSLKPIVVMDGGTSPGQRKLPKMKERFLDRLRLAEQIGRGERGKVLPTCAEEVFFYVLRELNIEHFVCDFDADLQTASLARSLTCPLLSNDGDFYVCHLPGGLLPLSYLDMNACRRKAGHPFMKAQIFHSENLLSCYPGLLQEHLPLFATLMGTDYISRETFENFFSQIRVPKDRGAHQRHLQMIVVLKWLSAFPNRDEAIREVLRLLGKDEDSRLAKNIQLSIQDYEATGEVSDWYSSHLKIRPEAACPAKFCHCESSLLLRNIHVGVFSSFFLDVTLSQPILINPQIENFQAPSAHTCTAKVRAAIYGVLRDSRRDLCKVLALSLSKEELGVLQRSLLSQETTALVEYSREKRQLSKDQIHPLVALSDGSRLPTYAEISSLHAQTRRALFLDLLGLHTLGEEETEWRNSDWEFMFWILRYWLLEANPRVTLLHLECLLLSWILISICSDFQSSTCRTAAKASSNNVDLPELPDPSHQTDDERLTCAPNMKPGAERDPQNARVTHFPAVDIAQLQKVRSALQTYTLGPERPGLVRGRAAHKQSPDVTALHGFAQYQSCHKYLSHLNALLGWPVRPVCIAQIFNGSFVCALYQHAAAQRNRASFVREQLLQNSVGLVRFFEHSVALATPDSRDVVANVRFTGRKGKNGRRNLDLASDRNRFDLLGVDHSPCQ